MSYASAQQLFEQMFPMETFNTDTDHLPGEDEADWELRIHRTFAAIALDDMMDHNMIDPQSDAGQSLIRLALSQLRRVHH